MEDLFWDLTIEFTEVCQREGLSFVFKIVEDFCNKNTKLREGCQIDGLPGLLNYVKYVYENYERGEYAEEKTSLIEIASLLWKLERLGRIDLADNVASDLISGFDFGETRGYSDVYSNSFRNFELQLHIGLRLLEMGLGIQAGGDSEPDYIITDPSLVIEVKAPGSKIALLQDTLKAIKQIERSEKPGIIVLSCDHMIKRNIINIEYGQFPPQILDVLFSVLPEDPSFTIGAIIEWNDPNGGVVYPVYNQKRNNSSYEHRRINLVFQSIASDTSRMTINCREPNICFPFNVFSSLDPTEDGRRFYEENWGAD